MIYYKVVNKNNKSFIINQQEMQRYVQHLVDFGLRKDEAFIMCDINLKLIRVNKGDIKEIIKKKN